MYISVMLTCYKYNNLLRTSMPDRCQSSYSLKLDSSSFYSTDNRRCFYYKINKRKPVSIHKRSLSKSESQRMRYHAVVEKNLANMILILHH